MAILTKDSKASIISNHWTPSCDCRMCSLPICFLRRAPRVRSKPLLDGLSLSGMGLAFPGRSNLSRFRSNPFRERLSLFRKRRPWPSFPKKAGWVLGPWESACLSWESFLRLIWVRDQSLKGLLGGLRCSCMLRVRATPAPGSHVIWFGEILLSPTALPSTKTPCPQGFRGLLRLHGLVT
jgi:hypothetical protein